MISANRPDLWNATPPASSAASEAIAAKREEGRDIEGEDSGEEGGSARMSLKKRKLSHFSILDVSDIAVSKGIKSYLEVRALAKGQKMEATTDLTQFIVNRGKAKVEEAIKTGWEIEISEQTLMRQQMLQMDILYESLAENCVEYCEGRCLEMELDILQRNNIQRDDFCSAVRKLFEKGRGKYRNILSKPHITVNLFYLISIDTDLSNVFEPWKHNIRLARSRSS